LNQGSGDRILPVAGRSDLFNIVQASLGGQPLVDHEPGAGLLLADFAFAFIRPAAGTVVKPFGAHGHRAYAPGPSQNTALARTATLLIPAHRLVYRQAGCVHRREDRRIRKPFRQELNSHAAGHGQHRIVFSDLVVQFGQVFSVALPFHREFVYLDRVVVQLPGHIQFGTEYGDFLFAAGQAHGYTGPAAYIQDPFVILEHLLQFIKGFSLGNYHCSSRLISD